MTFTSSKNTIAGIIGTAEKRLAAADIGNPKLDARVLTAYALQLDRAQLLGQLDRVLSDKEKRHVEVLIECRARHEPVARILHKREFWSLEFGLNEATLVPRPESETLIEAALKLIHPGENRDPGNLSTGINGTTAGVVPKLQILDLGSGSGCLLLALLHELPQATGLGVDCAPRAVEQAKQNAATLGLSERAEFRINDWADGIDERFDIVVSNPPYIAKNDIATLMPDVRDYDPKLALDGGEDGLDAYRALIPQLPRLLNSDGLAIFEIGIGQSETVRALFQKAGFTSIGLHRDLGGIPRCIAARSSGK